MEYGYSILMGLFAAMILAYAGLMALTKDYRILPVRSRQSIRPKDEKKYMTQMAKTVALVSLAPALSALAGLWNIFAALAVLIGGLIVFIWIGTKLMEGLY